MNCKDDEHDYFIAERRHLGKSLISFFTWSFADAENYGKHEVVLACRKCGNKKIITE